MTDAAPLLPETPPEPQGPERLPLPWTRNAWEHQTLGEHLHCALWRMLGDAPAHDRGGPWSWTLGALARDATGNPVDPCAPEARSWDLLGALQAEWSMYPEGMARDCAKRALYCAVRDAGRLVLRDSMPSLSSLNDELGWRAVRAVLELARALAPTPCEATRAGCGRRATHVDLATGYHSCWRHRLGADAVSLRPRGQWVGRNEPWDGSWWGCKAADWNGLCRHADGHLGEHDYVCL